MYMYEGPENQFHFIEELPDPFLHPPCNSSSNCRLWAPHAIYCEGFESHANKSPMWGGQVCSYFSLKMVNRIMHLHFTLI